MQLKWQRIDFFDKELLQTIKKSQQPKRKRSNRYFTKKEIRIDLKHMKRYSTSFITRELQVKTIMKFNLLDRQRPKYLKTQSIKDCVKKGISYIPS